MSRNGLKILGKTSAPARQKVFINEDKKLVGILEHKLGRSPTAHASTTPAAIADMIVQASQKGIKANELAGHLSEAKPATARAVMDVLKTANERLYGQFLLSNPLADKLINSIKQSDPDDMSSIMTQVELQVHRNFARREQAKDEGTMTVLSSHELNEVAVNLLGSKPSECRYVLLREFARLTRLEPSNNESGLRAVDYKKAFEAFVGQLQTSLDDNKEKVGVAIAYGQIKKTWEAMST